MSIRALITSLFLLAALGSAHGSVDADGATQSVRADAAANQITDADKFLAEVAQTVAMARDGQYGAIKRDDIERLKRAEATIVSLLEGQPNARHLQPDDRIALFNAQEEITGIVRNQDKDRRICKRVAGTGTRLAKAECLTVAQREAQAQSARLNTDRIQREHHKCVPGEMGNSSC